MFRYITMITMVILLAACSKIIINDNSGDIGVTVDNHRVLDKTKNVENDFSDKPSFGGNSESLIDDEMDDVK